MEVDQALKVGATNSNRCPNLTSLFTAPSVCIKVMLGPTVVPYPHEHILQQDNDPKHKFKLCQNYLRKEKQVNQRFRKHFGL